MSAARNRRKLVRYILFALEKHEHNVDYDYEITPATIEHILPERPDSSWNTHFPPDIHERYVNRLGNYLLLEPKLNAKEAANKPLATKLAAYNASQYPSTRAFNWPDWTPTAIDKRQAKMAKMATAIWRF